MDGLSGLVPGSDNHLLKNGPDGSAKSIQSLPSH